MGEKPKNLRRFGMKILAVAVTLAAASGLSYSFATGLRDGMRWQGLSARALVSPTFVEEDLKGAKIVPDFTLKDRFGKPVKLSQFAAAEVVLVNIWTTGCPSCKRELPALSELDRRLASLGKVVLITITTNEKWEEVEHLFPLGTDLRVLFDPEEKVTKEMFGSTRYPETFILDEKRRIRVRFDGERQWHAEEMLDFIASFVPRS